MTALEARDHLARLQISQQAFARLIRVNPATVRRWLNVDKPADIPIAVAIALDLLTPDKIRDLQAAAAGPAHASDRIRS